MNYKKIMLLFCLIMATVFLFPNKAYALSAPYLTLNISEDIVTNDNAVLNAKLNNIEKRLVDSFEIVILKDNVEVKKYEKSVNRKDAKLEVSFNLKKELGVQLKSNTTYQYTITAKTSENVNPDMYKASHKFTTQSVKTTVSKKEIKDNNAILSVKVDNPNKQLIKNVGIIVLSGNKKIQEFKKELNSNLKNINVSFNLKKELALQLKPKTKYSYVVYAEIDVSSSYLYIGRSEAEGTFKTTGKTGISCKTTKSKKLVTFCAKINNPNLKKISGVKIIIKKGKKKVVTYKKNISKKKAYLNEVTTKIKIKKSLIKKMKKSKKYQYVMYVIVGGKTYKIQGSFKL